MSDADVDRQAMIAAARAAILAAGTQRLLFPTPAAESFSVDADVHYANTVDTRVLRIARPRPDSTDDAPPVVLFVSGYPDAGLQRIFGRAWRDVGQIESWAQLLASRGIATAVYVNDEPAPDALLALQYLQREGAALNIDPARIGVWSVSGNVPNALDLLATTAGATVRCAVLSNGFFFGNAMRSAARQYGFVAPADDSAFARFSTALALFVIRSGRDENVGLNDSLDAFVAQTLTANKSLSLLNLPDAPHNFEVAYDHPSTRATIRQIIAFYQTHLRDRGAAGAPDTSSQ